MSDLHHNYTISTISTSASSLYLHLSVSTSVSTQRAADHRGAPGQRHGLPHPPAAGQHLPVPRPPRRPRRPHCAEKHRQELCHSSELLILLSTIFDKEKSTFY